MAVNVQTIQGDWNHLCSLAKKRWHQLKDEDLRVHERNIEQLITRIQHKTGEGREAIERYFHDVGARGSSAAASAVEAVGQYAHLVGDQVRERYDSAEGVVRRHPTETVIAAFGLGLFGGVVASHVLRSR